MTAYLSKDAADKVYFAARQRRAPRTRDAEQSLRPCGQGQGGRAVLRAARHRGRAGRHDHDCGSTELPRAAVPADGTFLRQWGGIGTAPDKFGQINGYAFGPTGLAIAPDGTIYVADTWNHRISAFTSDGKPLRQWGSFFNGQEDPADSPKHTGEFYGPRGIAIGPNGLLYVTDTGNSRILVFDPEWPVRPHFRHVRHRKGQMDNPVGIAARADGTIAVADTNNARILLFTADGQFQSALPVADWATVKGLEAYTDLPAERQPPHPLSDREPADRNDDAGANRPHHYGRPRRSSQARRVRTVTRTAQAPIVVNDETNTVVKVSLT